MEIRDGVFRRKKVSFSMIPNDLIQNEAISLKAKGLYALIQSYITREDFDLYKTFLMSKCHEGKAAFETAWKELKLAGYLKAHRMQGEKGRFYYEYELLDVPELEKEAEETPKPEKKEEPTAPEAGRKPGRKPEKARQAKRPERKSPIPEEVPELEQAVNRPTLEDLKEQVDFETFNEVKKKEIEPLLMLMEEVFNMKPGQTLRINQTEIECSKVQERFKSFDIFTIEYVLGTLADNKNRVKNTRSYMLTALFNAPTTQNYYFQNWVQHDMYNS